MNRRGPNGPQRGREDSYSNSYVPRSGRGFDPREREPRDRERDRVRDTRGADPRIRRDNRYDNYRDSSDQRGGYNDRNNGHRDRYSSRESNYPRNETSRDSRKPASQQPQIDPNAGLSKEEIIAKYEKKLASLLKYPAMDVFPVASSQWGTKPKGFENVTAQRAKMSGLFPLPGSPRPVDMTKVEGLLQEGLSESGVLQTKSKINPSDSRNSCILIVRDVDFLKVDYMKVAEYLNKFVCSVDLEGTFLDNNIEKKRKTRDNHHMVVEFKNNTCATLALALNGRKIPGGELYLSESNIPEDLTLKLERPGEYVVQCLPPYDANITDVEEEVKDSPRKLTVFVDKLVTETMLINELTTVAKLKGFKLLREVGTKELTGIAFVEYFVDPKQYPKTKLALKLISDYVDETRELSLVQDVVFSCIKVSSSNGVETSIQDCPIDVKTLKALVRNEYVPYHPKLRVIQLINAVAAADLTNDDFYNFLKLDILEEMKQFGNVVSWKIPRPLKDFVPGLNQLNQPGLGKIYIEFEDEKIALSALMGIAGRCYNDRTVLCAFYSHDDYLTGLL